MSDAPTPTGAGRGDAPGRRGPSLRLALAALLTLCPAAATAGHDPDRTVTIYVHGFERQGAAQSGVYGADLHEPLADSIAAMAGLPAGDATGGPIPRNAVLATTYYGDTAPAWFTAGDRAEIDHLTATWGGGVPRYAYIVARYAQQALARSGADQVNFVSASFGSLVVRWLIEKDVAGLAGSGRVARWLTIEGLIAGNWAASQDDLVGWLDFVQPQPIDVAHMDYDWVSTHLHAPRTEADHPAYAGILIGQMASSDDSANDGALTAAMLARGQYQPNDGVQAVPDARFQSLTPRSRLLGLPPTLSLFHVHHLGIQRSAGAFAQAATFVTGRRRVTVTMTGARVTNLHEPQLPFWDWTPAEVVFESRVHSPAVQARWGIAEPICARVKEGATAPLRRFRDGGESQALNEIVFDDLVLPEETELLVHLRAAEVDYDRCYGVFETITTPWYDDLGGGVLSIPIQAPGSYAFATADWSCTLAVAVRDYPFAAPVAVPAAPPRPRAPGLVFAPNPSAATVRVTFADLAADPLDAPARLEIADLAGRLVRRIDGSMGAGFLWDGRDAQGRRVPAGVYLHRAITPRGIVRGRSCRLE